MAAKGATGAIAVENLQATFTAAHLKVPPIPKRFVAALTLQHEWLWTTRLVHRLDMHMFDRYPDEVLMDNSEGYDVADYLAISHGGHGVNSYFLTYQLVTRRLAVFVQVGWGGAYMSEETSRRDVAVTYEGIDSLLSAAAPLIDAHVAPGPRLVVLASPSRGVGADGWLGHRLGDRKARTAWINNHRCHSSSATAHARQLLDEDA